VKLCPSSLCVGRCADLQRARNDGAGAVNGSKTRGGCLTKIAKSNELGSGGKTHVGGRRKSLGQAAVRDPSPAEGEEVTHCIHSYRRKPVRGRGSEGIRGTRRRELGCIGSF